MSAQRDCIDAQDLSEFLLGNLDEVKATKIEYHLSVCSHCATSLYTISAEDALVDSIRTAASNRTPYPNDCVEKLVDKLCQFPPSFLYAETTAYTISDLDKILSPPGQENELGFLGQYRIRSILGQGGMGIVFSAVDPKLNRVVALKVLRPDLLSKPIMRQRFLREARATAALDHDNIVTIHHVGEESAVPFFVMPLLVGETLGQKIKRTGKFPQREVVSIGKQIAAGLAAAHSNGLVHRDVNPANIWLQVGEESEPTVEEGERNTTKDQPYPSPFPVKILDFGLARINDETENLTESGIVMGTPGYIAPELANDAPFDSRCDQFGLGCVLYEMSTGKPPFRRGTVMASLLAAARETPEAPHRRCPHISPQLSNLILKLLAKDPRKRFRSCLDVIVDLEKCNLCNQESPTVRLWAIVGGIIAGLLASVLVITSYSMRSKSHEKNRPQEFTKKEAGKETEDALVSLKPLRRFMGHTAAVLCVAISPDGRIAASGGADNTIRIWDVQSAKTIHTFVGHTGEVRAIDFSPRGDFLISVSSDRTARLWDVLDKKAIWKGAKHSDEYHDVAFSRNGSLALGASRHKSISLWEPNTADLITNLHWHPCAVRCVAFAPDNRHALSADENGNVMLWDTKKPRAKFHYKGHTGVVSSLQISRFGRYAITGSWDKTVRLWDLREGKQYHCLKGHTGQVFTVALTADNAWILSGGAEKQIRLHNASTGRLFGFLKGHTDHVMAIASSHDSRYALSASSDHSVLLWQLPKGTTELSDP